MNKLSININIFSICKRLQRIRKNLGFKSAKKFAEILGIKYTTYSNYEKSRIPPAEFIAFLKAKYPQEVDLNWLFAGEKDQDIDPGNDEPKPDEYTQTLAGTIDTEIMTRIIIRVEQHLSKMGKLPPDKKARLYSLLYERQMESGKEIDDKTVVSYLKLVI